MVRITVNGKAEFVGFPTLSYEQIVGIVNDRRRDRRQPLRELHTVVFSYRDNAGQRGGTLAPGQSVPVQHEMAIVALVTDNA